MPEPQVAVVGAGPAGLAAAVALKDRRLRPLLIDQADEVAPVWRARYDRLRLNTCRPLSHLPRRRFAKGTPMFPRETSSWSISTATLARMGSTSSSVPASTGSSARMAAGR